MYKIYIDGVLFHDSTLEEMQIESGTITREVNKAGSFKFAIYPDHPFYDFIKELKTVIEVYKDGEVAPVFRGRALYPEFEFFQKKTYTCEGHYNFLLDSIMRAFEGNYTPAELFTMLIENHNSQVEAVKRFAIGEITVTGERVEFSNTSAVKTQDVIKKHLLDNYGGYVLPRFDDGVWYLDYLNDCTDRGTQAIEFGENLSKFTRKDDYSNIVTALIPYGDDDITVANVNGGSDIIFDATGVSLYGTIVDSEKFDDIASPATLLTEAQTYLSELVKKQIVIEVNAIDLSLLDRNIESLKFATYNRIISEPHALDDWFLITKQTINLTDPTKDSVVLGGTFESFTDQTTKAENAVKNITNNVGTVVEKADKVISIVENITDISSGYDEITNDTGENGDLYIRMMSEEKGDGGEIYVKQAGEWVLAVQGGASESGGASDEVLTEHIEDKNNPHGVTLSQVGFTSGADNPNDAIGKDGDVYLQMGCGEEHTLIGHLESTGEQYIDTGFKPNQNTRIVCDYQSSGVINQVIFGARTSASVDGICFYPRSGGYWGDQYNDTTTNTSVKYDDVRHIVDKNKNITSLDGVVCTTFSESTFDVLFNLYLFASNDNGVAKYFGTTKIYSCQIYDNDVLVRDYIPVIDANGEACLYDKLNNVYYRNKGTGAFTAGAEIPQASGAGALWLKTNGAWTQVLKGAS